MSDCSQRPTSGRVRRNASRTLSRRNVAYIAAVYSACRFPAPLLDSYRVMPAPSVSGLVTEGPLFSGAVDRNVEALRAALAKTRGRGSALPPACTETEQ